jgi:hypothetical protein
MATITTGLTITSTFGSWYIGELPLRADPATVAQFCTDKGYVPGGTFTSDGGTFSNDGGRFMNYYGLSGEGLVTGSTYHWLNHFGYDDIVTSITEP